MEFYLNYKIFNRYVKNKMISQNKFKIKLPESTTKTQKLIIK